MILPHASIANRKQENNYNWCSKSFLHCMISTLDTKKDSYTLQEAHQKRPCHKQFESSQQANKESAFKNDNSNQRRTYKYTIKMQHWFHTKRVWLEHKVR